MLMLCEPAETGMDAVKFVDVSLPRRRKGNVGPQIAIEKNFQPGAGGGNLKSLEPKMSRSEDS